MKGITSSEFLRWPRSSTQNLNHHPRSRERIIIVVTTCPPPQPSGSCSQRGIPKYTLQLQRTGSDQPVPSLGQGCPLDDQAAQDRSVRSDGRRRREENHRHSVKPQPSAPCAFEVEYLEIQNEDRDRATIESLSIDLAAKKELYVTSYDRDLDSVKSLAAKQNDRPPDARVHTPAVIRRDRSRFPRFTDPRPNS